MAKEKKEKKNKRDELLKYTARDIGQEYIMKRKMLSAIFWAIILAIALVVFIALYVEESHRIQETYRTNYIRAIETLQDDINSYVNAEGDKDFWYRMVVADMSTVNSFSFLIDDFTEEQKCINGLYTVLLKYPQQSTERMDEIQAILDDVLANLDKGYVEMAEFVESVNKKGF